MGLLTLKPTLLRYYLLRVLSFSVLILAVRFAFIVTVAGGYCGSDNGGRCFFPKNDALPGGEDVCQRHTSAGESLTRDLFTTKRYRKTVDYYSSVFQDLVDEGFLSSDSKALCVETLTGEDVVALREIGVFDSIGISKNPSPPLLFSGEAYRHPFDNNTFDFEFAGKNHLDGSGRPGDFASEVCRTLKPGGFFVVHTMAKDLYSFNSFLDLFSCCRLVRALEIDGFDSSSIREIVMRKETEFLGRGDGISIGNNCSVPAYKRVIIGNAEPLIEEEPLKPWISLKRSIKSIKYLTSMVDISFKQRYVYVDVGARNYGSSIGNWFLKQYPKQNKTFEIYAIEADNVFHEEYKRKKGVILLPHAAWIRNETLFFEISRDTSNVIGKERRRRGMGRIQPVMPSTSYMQDLDKIQGFDFANWLKNTVTRNDFVVVKMDAEGAEFYLIPKLIKTGAICLIDELFLVCHYNKMQRCCPGVRSSKYEKTYGQCLDLFNSLRKSGVLVHQWW
ncbi:uncharacterized protein LOC133792769 [Humulus lupulus]|uniref:uncharacterized protein LOC133792769 n=1 Tax=Humulus lupulus TaxID=3486 RepID=UPI002B40CAA1|nr:uncharacterized protein LOC133792769 [Humulus lupulus]